MNAFNDSSELVRVVLSYVSGDMFLVQSVVTCGALFWCVVRAVTLRIWTILTDL